MGVLADADTPIFYGVASVFGGEYLLDFMENMG